MTNNNPKISIILPCRNEEQGLDFCLKEIKDTISKNNLSAEIIVSDSSTDKSPQVAVSHNVVLVKHDKEGYGMAHLEAFKIAEGKYIFMADADASYSFTEIPNFISQLESGFDMVIGNRFAGKMHVKAMTFSHRFIGNPILSFILRLFFKAKIRDSQCGMRAIKTAALKKLNLQTTGMEFASEMIIKALKNNLKIKELPIDYFPRRGHSKMRSFRDAWKHIRFMLLYSPLFLFFIPGAIIFFLGALLFSPLLIISGYQLIIFSFFAKIYSITHLGEKNENFEKLFKYITIEKALALSVFLIILGLTTFLLAHGKNLTIISVMLTVAIQTIFSAFMLSILGIKEK